MDFLLTNKLGKRKKLSVQSYNGVPLVDIREYYVKDDEELPGKKVFFLDQNLNRRPI